MINILFGGNYKVFDGILLCLMSMTKHCKNPLNVYILTASLTDLNPEYTPITKNQVATLENIIKHAKSLGMCTVQRFFIVDGQSVKTALETIHQTKPSYAELMPGLIYIAITEFSAEQTPIIAGGLINKKEELLAAINSGAVAVSTSEDSLWELEI